MIKNRVIYLSIIFSMIFFLSTSIIPLVKPSMAAQISLRNSLINNTAHANIYMTYLVTFTEHRLPSGMPWTVQLGPTYRHSLSDVIQFNETSGIYQWHLVPILGFAAYPSSGSVMVYSNRTIEIQFLQTNFSQRIDNFSFPYTYQQPPIPSNYGAHSPGPSVPISDIGIKSNHIGVKGIIGHNWKGEPFPFIQSKVRIHVFNGTYDYHTNAIHASVYLINTSTGTVTHSYTSSSGYTNESITEGYYLVIVNDNNSANINFTYQFDFRSSFESINVYLMPSTYDNSQVNNGGTDDLYVSAVPNFGSNFFMPQIEVTLLNESSSGSILGSAYTGSNGTALFSGLSNAYKYAVTMDGYSNNVTDIVYGMTNYTSAPFSLNNQTTRIVEKNIFGISSSTASLTGISAPVGAAPWDITGNATIDGGVTVISSQIKFLAPYSLTIENATVYVNESANLAGNETSLLIQNSSIIFLGTSSSVIDKGQYNVRAFDSTIVGLKNVLGDHEPILNMSFENVSNSVFFGMDFSPLSLFDGNFFNDYLVNSTSFVVGSKYNGYTNMTCVTISNSTLKDIYPGYGTVTFERVYMTNSTTNLSARTFNAYDTFLNETIPYEHLPRYGSVFGYIDTVYFDMTNSVFTVSPPANTSFQSFITNITPNRKNGAYPSSPYVVFAFGGVGEGFGTNYINFTDSELTRTFPPVNMNIQFGQYSAYSFFNNDILDFNYSLSQVSEIMNSYSSGPFLGGRISLTFLSTVYMNYSIIDGGLGLRIVPYPWNNLKPDYFAHDLFPFTYDIQSYSYFRLFPESNGGTYYFENDSFEYIYWNYSWWATAQDGAGFADIWMESLANRGFNSQAKPLIYIEYDTFWSPSFGSGGNGISGNIEFAERNITGYVSHNLFENSPDYVLGVPDNYSDYFFAPHMDDILATAANVTISNNIFTNLTNLTVPIGTDQAYQWGGSGGNVTLQGNEFFYHPAIGGLKYINVSWPWYIGGEWGKVVSFPGETGYSGSDLSYELPMGYFSTIYIKNSTGQPYIFNSTVGQNETSSYMNNPNYQTRVPQQWSWIVEPDFIWSGSTYVVEYRDTGGPQPSLFYNGSLYNLAVEKSYVYISTSSKNASSIHILLFESGVQPDSIVSYGYTNAVTGVSSILGQTYAHGPNVYVNLTYNPLTMSSASIFYLVNSTTKTNSTGEYKVSFFENGLRPGTTWGISLDGNLESSRSTIISFMVNSGDYSFSVANISGYYGIPSNGSINVDNSNVSQTIDFLSLTTAKYNITFIGTGLPKGLKWEVSIDDTTLLSENTSIFIMLSNGTYGFNIISPSNYSSKPSMGILNVSGSNIVIIIKFQELNSKLSTKNPIAPFGFWSVIRSLYFVLIISMITVVVILVAIIKLLDGNKKGNKK